MKRITFGLLLSIGLAAQAEIPKTTGEFCKNLEKAVDPKGQDFKARSLARVEMALGGEDFGTAAKSSIGPMKDKGFVNLKDMDAKVMDHLPEGAILVLKHSRKCKGVNKSYGHMLVRCGGQFFDNSVADKHTDKIKYRGGNDCVAGVMYYPGWDPKPAGGGETGETPAGS